MFNSTKEGVCSINKQDDGQTTVQSGGNISIQIWPFLSSTMFNDVFWCLCAAALVHLWPGWEGVEERRRLCGSSEDAGRDGSCVGSEHAAGGARCQPAAHRYRNKGKQHMYKSDGSSLFQVDKDPTQGLKGHWMIRWVWKQMWVICYSLHHHQISTQVNTSIMKALWFIQ